MSIAAELQNCVRARRTARGWSQQELADRAGLARASVSAIEIQRLTPSTAAALALAAALDCRVEDLFEFPRRQSVEPNWAWPPTARLCRYWQAEAGGHTWLYPYEATQLGTIEHDGVFVDGHAQLRAVAVPRTLVMACCDPAVGLLARELARSSGIRLLALFRSSRQALALLKQGLVHVAGCHLSHADDDGNMAAVAAELGPGYTLVRVAQWDEGVATSNPERSSLRTLVRSKTRWVGRELGSGARQCLDELLGSRPAPRRTARDHRGVAEAIRSGWADAGVCLRITAEEANLNFLSVRQEAYDLCFDTRQASEPRIQALIEVLESVSYRRLIDDLPGYRSTGIGTTVAVP